MIPSLLLCLTVGKTDASLEATWCVDCYNDSLHVTGQYRKRELGLESRGQGSSSGELLGE